MVFVNEKLLVRRGHFVGRDELMLWHIIGLGE
jgi:hypothetical protein